MRHRNIRLTLGLKEGHRNALLSNMSTSLILNKRIRTTEAKAKALTRFIEKIITKARENNLNSWRSVARYIRDKEALRRLFNEIAPKYDSREGGYTRIILLGNRLGDGARMALIELVGFEEEILEKEQKEKKEKCERRKKRREEREKERRVREEETTEEGEVEEEEKKPARKTKEKEVVPKESKPEEKKRRFFLFRRKKDKDPMKG
ncbi:MAG: 50S ribosomal protein L17 [bacterium]